MARAHLRQATEADLGLLVRHRRAMWEAVADLSKEELDAADPVYRRWARERMKSGRFAGFIVDVGGEPVASGCVCLTDVQPRPHWRGTTVAYLLSMFTEPDHRGEGHATRIVRAAIRWARARGLHAIQLHASEFGEPIYARLGFQRTTEMRLIIDPEARRRRDPRTPQDEG